VFGPSRALDFELELAAWIGRGNGIGMPISLADARDHILGFSLLNDWSAKDVQWWEQILGPFQGKSFLSTISPWIVTEDALAPFRMARPARVDGQPEPLPHLDDPIDRASGGLMLRFTASLSTLASRKAGMPPMCISTTSAQAMHWTFGQMIAHHTANGCNLRSGDLLGSGTLSGQEDSERACMTELTYAGAEPLTLSNGESRGWLENGDEIHLAGRADAPGFVSIGFGPCIGRVSPALATA
jgi:fumarylacetoacetase